MQRDQEKEERMRRQERCTEAENNRKQVKAVHLHGELCTPSGKS